MTARHRTALPLALLAGACGPRSQPDEVVQIRPHWWAACEPSRPPREVALEIAAEGDFDPSPNTVEALAEDADTTTLGIPADTRAVRTSARDGFGTWQGLGQRRDGQAIDVSLWPNGAACELARGTGAFPTVATDRPDQAFGVSAAGAILVFGGGTSTSSATSALLGDLDEARIAPTDLDPRHSRAGARATSFDGTLLVSGGTDPRADGAPLDSAEILDVGAARFDPDPIELSAPRSRHAAVATRDGGALLIGGRDASGAALATLEWIDPETRRFRIAGLADLAVARIDPIAITLTDGSVVVAGGRDASGNAVRSVEWLSADASRIVRTLDTLEPNGETVLNRALVAMPGGGFLAAGGCAPARTDVPDATTCMNSCQGNGCPVTSAIWVTADGAITRLDSALEADVYAPHPTLVAGEGGRPWLATGDPTAPKLLRFEPWTDPDTGRPWFVEPDAAPRVVPSWRAAVLAGTPGTLLWLERPEDITDDDPVTLLGFRYDTRTEFSEDVAPLIRGGTAHLAPDRPPVGAAATDGVRYDATTGALRIDDPRATVSVTELSFAALGLALTRREGPLPRVHLGSLVVGGADCPWPSAPDGPAEFRVARAEADVQIAVGEATSRCKGPAGRVRVRVGTAAPGLALEALTLRRTASLDIDVLGGR